MARWSRLGLLYVGLLAVLVLFVRLGFWQLDRLEERRARNALILERSAAPVALVEEVVPELGASPGQASYRRVEARGTYDRDRGAVLIGRALDGRPGSHLLTPLVLEDGRAVVVDRGWVPYDPEGGSPPEAAPPGGAVVLRGLLLPPEGDARLAAGRGGLGTLTRVDLDELGRRLPYPVLPAYLVLEEQDPAQEGAFPVPPPGPDLDEGPHLSYAVQWFLFAAVGAVTGGVLLRRDLRRRRGGGDQPSATNSPTAVPSGERRAKRT
ncbi:MAG: SURF1 family protein [Actinobacteria bacterium]|nr:SURF1 family protein [Actinomycetota bacterium]